MVLYGILGISVLLALGMFGVFNVPTKLALKVLGAAGLTVIATASIVTLVVIDSQTLVNPNTSVGYSINYETVRTFSWSFFNVDVIVWAFYVGGGLLGLAVFGAIAHRLIWPATKWSARFVRRHVVRGFIALAARMGKGQTVAEAKAHQKRGPAGLKDSDIDLNAIRVADQQAQITREQ